MSHYLRYLLRNDQLAPAIDLAGVIAAQKPSKYMRARLPLSLPLRMRRDANKAAKRHGLDFSPYVVALALRDCEKPEAPLVILPAR